MARIVELHCYPIKGCAGTPLHDAVLTPAGITHDRSFLVVGPDGVGHTQRRTPRLAVVRPEVSADGTVLTLRANGMDAARLTVTPDGPHRDVESLGKPYRGIDQGGTAADWLSDLLGEPVRLVRVPPDHDRVTDGAIPGTAGYADGSAVLLTTVSSLAELNHRIEAAGRTAVPMERFRPNIVVDGWDRPHAEDGARRITLGDAELGYTKLAIRCAVTTVHQHTGARVGPEPLRTLATYRRATTTGVAFGTKFAVLRPGKLSVGDEPAVTTWAPPEL